MTVKLDKLSHAFRTKLVMAMDESKAAGTIMVPYVADRDPWEQARLWRRSRNKAQVEAALTELRAGNAKWLADVLESVGPQPTGPWATNALPGFSYHQWGTACDLYWLKNGKTEWNDLTGYAAFAAHCKHVGLTHGYFWKSRDAVHVQLHSETKPVGTMAQIDAAMRAVYQRP